MSRVPDLDKDKLTAAQKQIYDDIASVRRGNVKGPFAIWLRVPEIADKANQFGNVLRAKGSIEKRLFELMVLVVARRWSAQYEWFAHEDQALKAGVSTEVVEALRHQRRPEFQRDDERLVYELTSALQESKTLAIGLYDRGVAAFGLDQMIEFVTAVGFYTMVAVMLNAFDAPVPGEHRPLPDLT
jgi:4-carboxymuconolactone decarboxylase